MSKHAIIRDWDSLIYFEHIGSVPFSVECNWCVSFSWFLFNVSGMFCATQNRLHPHNPRRQPFFEPLRWTSDKMFAITFNIQKNLIPLWFTVMFHNWCNCWGFFFFTPKLPVDWFYQPKSSCPEIRSVNIIGAFCSILKNAHIFTSNLKEGNCKNECVEIGSLCCKL